jgi:phytanoyl-CoA hydroxylase
LTDAMSEQELSEYAEQGFVLIRGLFSKEELDAWCTRLQRVVAGNEASAEGMLVMRDVMFAKGAAEAEQKGQEIAKLQDFENDPVLGGYLRHPRLLDRVETFTGPDIASIHTMLINKPPGVDGRHPLHQDLLYFPFRPAEDIVGTWTALERSTREKGCLAVVPGSHRGDLLRHENPDWEYLNLGYFGAAGVGPHPDRVHVEMEPGDTLFFHPLLLHGSGRNRSAGFRRAISAHYASTHCRYLNDGFPRGSRPYTLMRGHVHPGGILGEGSAAAPAS